MKFFISLSLCSFLAPILLLGQPSRSPDQKSTSKVDEAGHLQLTPYQRVSMYLGHSLFKAEPVKRQGEILWGISAIKPMLEIADDLEGQFEKDRIEQKMLAVLREKAVPIDMENGQLLLFRIRGIWDKPKVTLLYTYDLDLIDNVYVSREGQIKSNFRSVWNVSNLGYAGKDVYENAMLINVESAIDRFAISYFEQLDYDIISDTPRSAKVTYQRIRDGEEDILKLLADQKLAGNK